MRIALIVTVLNESGTISTLLQSILTQTRLPDEVIVVDGGSTDTTFAQLQAFAHQHPKLGLKVLSKPGNRSVGRNWAIRQTSAEWLACTDAGCELEPTWLAELIKTQRRTEAEVVAGYYQGQTETSWQAAVVPYVLVMPHKLPQPPEVFLPATRSMLMTKAAWETAGRFNEKLADNEDYALAHTFLKRGVKLAFCSTAIVKWQPPKTWGATFRMFYRFARGDAASSLWRPKVTWLFGRYAMGLGLLLVWMATGWNWLGWLVTLGLLLYLGWAIDKNRRYVPRGWGWLPIMQLTADWAVMSGSIVGLVRSIK